MRKPTITGAVGPDQLPGLLKGPFTPAYAILGTETFLRERVLSRLRDAFLKGEDPGTSLVVYHGPRTQQETSEVSPATVLDEAESPSLFGQRKMVVVRQCDIFARIHGDKLARGIERISGNCMLVLEGERIGARAPRGAAAGEEEGAAKSTGKALLDALRKHGAIVECQPPYATFYGSDQITARSDLGRMVADLARERGLRMADDAVVSLIEIAGERLSVLDKELDKIRERLAGPAETKSKAAASLPVSAEVVRDSCADARQIQVFALTDAVMKRKLTDSLEALHRVLTLGSADAQAPGKVVRDDQGIALMFFGSLYRSLSRLEAGRAALDAGGGYEEAGTAMEARKGLEAATGALANRWTSEELFRALERLLQADLSLKLSEAPPGEILERLIFDLCPTGRQQDAARR